MIENPAAMTAIAELRPARHHRVYDLVRSAGVNVSSWGEYKSGPAKASQNPKYCYEWAFVEDGKFIVLALWFDNMQVRDEEIFQAPNPRVFADHLRQTRSSNGAVISRAERMDHAISLAHRETLPVKVIVCDGRRRNSNDPDSKPSSVRSRKLDPVPWAVTEYDDSTGQCVIARGAPATKVVDQYSIPSATVKKSVLQVEAFCRDRKQRDSALRRALGLCEYCSESGFETTKGYIYLETHHVRPLSDGGADDERNIIALCANDHRKAHYGTNKESMQKELEDILSRYYS